MSRTAFVESRGGVSPPGAPKTVHDPGESHGSRCSAVAMAYDPVSKEMWVRLAKPGKPVSCPFWSDGAFA